MLARSSGVGNGTHSSIFAWKIPRTEAPGGLQSMGPQRVGHSVQFSHSVVSDCDPMNCSTPGFPVHHHFPEFTQTHVHWVGDAIQLFHPLSSPFLPPPIPPSIRVFSNESILCMRRPKYWSFSFSIIPSKEHPGLISSRMDWLDLLSVQGTLKSLLQHHSSKASILLSLIRFEFIHRFCVSCLENIL